MRVNQGATASEETKMKPRTCTNQELLSTINWMRADRLARAKYEAGLLSADELADLQEANTVSYPVYLSEIY